ncbi:ZBED6 C-terminal-like protein [Nannospalax galili]|uniref:ZBED6 C-terminal-like protein n=1 Tax=Nannospalax galili TaxID=1026970 RepID=UPI00081A1B31|nr:ZBED6 C-terminal-like protein [Nannospalax galili]XP_029419763.1 ZBED6 C-terminal-like protein [Nannospalax galili]
MEQNKKSPKRQKLPGSVGQEPSVSTSSPVTRPKNPVVTLAYPRPDFNTRATNAPTRFDWAAGAGLPETQVRLESLDIKNAINGQKRKVRPSSVSQKNCGRDLTLQRSSPCPLPSATLVPSADLDQVFLEKQVEEALSSTTCRGKRKTRSLGRSGLHSAASRAKCWTNPGQSKPKGDSGICSLKLVPRQEPSVWPEKRRVSQQKACAQREEGEKAVKRARSLPLSAGRGSSTPTLVQSLHPTRVTSPNRSEVDLQSREDETRQPDILTASLAGDMQLFKKYKKKHLLPGVRKKSGPQPSLQKPSCLKNLGRPIKAETHGLGSAPHFPGPQHSTILKPIPDIRQFFIVDLKNTCRIFCILCQTTVRQRKTQGWSRVSGLVRHLVKKHGLEWERRSTGSSVEGMGGVEQVQWKALPTGAASPALQGCLTPKQYPDSLPSRDSDTELVLGRPEQLCLASPLPITPTAVRDSQDGTHTPSQLRAQSWNHSITELLCSLALPLSFISSQPFRRFMSQVDPCYHLPSPGFFSDRALPLLHEAVGEQVLQEMQWAGGAHVHLTASTSAQDSVNYVAVTAHWVPDGRPVTSGSLRKRAVLLVRGLPLERAEEDRYSELLEQISLWLGRGSLKASFLVSGGCPSLERMAKAEGYIHVPCFIHCLDSLVNDFLCNHNSVQIVLGTAKAIFSHFKGCLEARRLLGQLQQQYGLPAQQPFSELSDHWVSAYHLMEWVLEQQQALQAYAEKQQPGQASTALSAMFWSLADSLVKLLQPFEMVSREASTAQASLSQVLPQLRYLHIFLEQVHRYFIEQSSGEVDVALRLAEGLALQLSTDCQLNELFYREEFVLATLLDPRFKGRVEAILPVGADIDHWKQVLVYKVKEIMVSECPLPTLGTLQSSKGKCMGITRTTRSPAANRNGQGQSSQKGGDASTCLLVQREKSLLQQLESVGLLASENSGASLSTENHMASVIVKKYLRENETIGAQEDPLAYWEKKREAWPALARLATVYLSCPPTGASSEGVFASLNSPTMIEPNSSLKVEAIEHLLFLKTNLESFPHYTPPPLVFASNGVGEGEHL